MSNSSDCESIWPHTESPPSAARKTWPLTWKTLEQRDLRCLTPHLLLSSLFILFTSSNVGLRHRANRAALFTDCPWTHHLFEPKMLETNKLRPCHEMVYVSCVLSGCSRLPLSQWACLTRDITEGLLFIHVKLYIQNKIHVCALLCRLYISASLIC